MNDDLRFVAVCPVIGVGMVSDTLLPSGRGAHLLFYGDVLELLLG